MRQPVRCKRTGLWLARYTDDGTVRQVGRHHKKSVAQQMIIDAIAADEGRPETGVTVAAFVDQWPVRFPCHPRTATNLERIRLPHLPRQGALPLQDLRRAQLRNVQEALLRKGWSKTTIDGAFSSLSAMLRDAVDDELLDGNPAHGFRVRPGDPRLYPKREPRRPRAVPVDELRKFFTAVESEYKAVALAPLLTGGRTSTASASSSSCTAPRPNTAVCRTGSRPPTTSASAKHADAGRCSLTR